MNNHLMNNQERFVKWKCPECGNYHKWVWDIYDIFGGEIAMTCDNPECGRTSKMCMVPEKNGNATAFVADNSQTETDISTVLIDGEYATIMGVKYKRVEPPKPTTLYDALQCPLHINGYHFNEDQKDWICKVVEEWLSDGLLYDGEDYKLSWNESIEKINKSLSND